MEQVRVHLDAHSGRENSVSDVQSVRVQGRFTADELDEFRSVRGSSVHAGHLTEETAPS
ncbi:hypothetical protein KGD83_16750 [Nocardiopsis akebiae]|uniref:Uncharacterized protein n=1 Tax=Nocardiopsis akebiae TaxID=2831968 RepID=A0ABX8BXY8_9ACTN|nr:hypothetical protein [Nocardiopsis akebiae]QUX27001.1 hypothetical protein KGD83_16750 [Nocardiopsis akebiae]